LHSKVILVFHQTADDQGRSIGNHHVGRQLRRVLVGDVVDDRARAPLGMDLHPDHAVVRHEGTQSQQRSRVQKLDLLNGAGEVLGKRLESESLAELNLGALLVQDKDSGTCQDLGAAHRLQGPDETGYVVGDEPELDPVRSRRKTLGIRGCALGDLAGRRKQLGRIEADVAVQRRSGADRTQHIGQVIGDREVNPQLFVVLQVDAHDDRLDQDLDRPNVDLLDDLVDDFEVGFILLDDELVGVGE
jgi:hypothetical protein